MTQPKSDLDAVFSALSDPTRRGFVEQLARGPRSIGQLADTVPITLPAVSRHVRILEEAGLIERRKRGRTHWCSLRGEGLDAVQRFVIDTRSFWEGSLDRLAALVEDLDE